MAYATAMREQAPAMFNQLCRAGMLETHLKQKGMEARKMLDDLLALEPKTNGEVNPNARISAEEVVRDTLIDFPTPLKKQHPEMPTDLPMPQSHRHKALTSA